MAIALVSPGPRRDDLASAPNPSRGLWGSRWTPGPASPKVASLCRQMPWGRSVTVGDDPDQPPGGTGGGPDLVSYRLGIRALLRTQRIDVPAGPGSWGLPGLFILERETFQASRPEPASVHPGRGSSFSDSVSLASWNAPEHERGSLPDDPVVAGSLHAWPALFPSRSWRTRTRPASGGRAGLATARGRGRPQPLPKVPGSGWIRGSRGRRDPFLGPRGEVVLKVTIRFPPGQGLRHPGPQVPPARRGPREKAVGECGSSKLRVEGPRQAPGVVHLGPSKLVLPIPFGRGRPF